MTPAPSLFSNMYEVMFLVAMTIVNISTGILASYSLTATIAMIHWTWTFLSGLTLYAVFKLSEANNAIETKIYWFMGFMTTSVILELFSIISGFQSLFLACPQDIVNRLLPTTDECVWGTVYQFHAIYLSFVHIMLMVLLCCCVQDVIKERLISGNLNLYFHWHYFTALPFPALLCNMYSIYLITTYVNLFENTEAWGGYIAYTFWIVMKGLALGNLLFSLIISLWFSKAYFELSRLEPLLKFVDIANCANIEVQCDEPVGVEKA